MPDTDATTVQGGARPARAGLGLARPGARRLAMAENDDRIRTGAQAEVAPRAIEDEVHEVDEPDPDDEVDEWGYESFPASDPPQH